MKAPPIVQEQPEQPEEKPKVSKVRRKDRPYLEFKI